MLSEAPEGWSEPAPLSIYASNETRKWDEVEVLPYVGLEHIEQGTGQLLGFGESQSVTSAKNLFEPGDVLFGKLRPNLRKYWKADRRGICSTDILVLKSKQGLESNYLFTVVQSEPFLSFAENDAAGTKMPRTSWKRLETIELPLPPLNEQNRIAEILSSVDASIQATQSVIEQAERVKKFFASGITAGTMEQFEPIGFAPITSFCEINPSQKMTKGEVYKFVDMAALPINSSSVDSYSEKSLSSGGAKFRKGDTLFARITPCTENGKLGYVNFLNDNEIGFGSTEFTVLRSNQKNLKIVYVYCYSGILREHAISRMIGSTGRQRVPNDAFSEVELAIYSDDQQEEIVSIFSAFEEIQRINRKQLAQLQRVKKGLMDDLLTGKVRTV